MGLYSDSSPWWCRVKEAVCGEVSDMIMGYGSLADDMGIDIEAFTQDDMLKCKDIDDLPADWRRLAEKCIDHYDLKP